MTAPSDEQRADIACGFQDAIVEVLVSKALRAVKVSGLQQLVVAGGVGANRANCGASSTHAARERVASSTRNSNSVPTMAR
jgi:N6-L-threonylcarbamoyladenine synthase